MAWMMDTYSMKKGYVEPALSPGKPIVLGGSLGREEATGSGIVVTTREVLRDLELPFEGVHRHPGVRERGIQRGPLLAAAGAKIVAVSDVRGGIYKPDGLDVSALLLHRSEHSSIQGVPGTQPLTNDELVALECDVLIPAKPSKGSSTRGTPTRSARSWWWRAPTA